MAYMSYCRYEGTYQELRICLDNAEEHINGEAEYEVSESEIEFFHRMVTEFTDWMKENGILDDDVEIDEESLGNICSAMRCGNNMEEEDY